MLIKFWKKITTTKGATITKEKGFEIIQAVATVKLVYVINLSRV